MILKLQMLQVSEFYFNSKRFLAEMSDYIAYIAIYLSAPTGRVILYNFLPNMSSFLLVLTRG